MSGNKSGHEGQTRSGSARTSRCKCVRRRLLLVCAAAQLPPSSGLSCCRPPPPPARANSPSLAWLHHHSCLQWRVCPDCVSASEPERATIASARASAARRPRAMVRTFAVAQRFQCALVAQQCLARLHDEAKLGVHRVHACLLRLLRARERDTVWSARAGTRCQAAGRFGARERAFSALGASAGAGAASLFFAGGILAGDVSHCETFFCGERRNHRSIFSMNWLVRFRALSARHTPTSPEKACVGRAHTDTEAAYTRGVAERGYGSQASGVAQPARANVGPLQPWPGPSPCARLHPRMRPSHPLRGAPPAHSPITLSCTLLRLSLRRCPR